MKKLPAAQRRVLRLIARHDDDVCGEPVTTRAHNVIANKLYRRGYVEYQWRQHSLTGRNCRLRINDKGRKALGIF